MFKLASVPVSLHIAKMVNGDKIYCSKIQCTFLSDIGLNIFIPIGLKLFFVLHVCMSHFLPQSQDINFKLLISGRYFNFKNTILSPYEKECV